MFGGACTLKEVVLVAAIVALTCVAALLSIALTWPRPRSSASLGVEWQCKHSLLATNCVPQRL
jgi:hypothetical protein